MTKEQPTRRAGRPSRGLSEKIVVKITPALLKALDARVESASARAELADGEAIDRSTVVRRCLSKCLAAELRSAKP